MDIMETHPLILGYGTTFSDTFPLILIVGREPNNGTISDFTLGSYDFKKFPRCAFWNIGFKLFGHYNELSTPQLKAKFLNYNSSPIIFTDASANGIFNKVNNKQKIRETFRKDDLTNQVNKIFSHDNILKRVKLILISGLSSSVYNDFKIELEKKSHEKGIPTKEISFLFGNNYPKILEEMTELEGKVLTETYNHFERIKKGYT